MGVLDVLAVTYDDSYSGAASSADAGIALASAGIFFVIFLVLYVVLGFLLYKIFQKASRPGWAGFIPVYNLWVLFEISGKPGWWALFALIPYAGGLILLVLQLLAALELAKRFGKSQIFAIFGLWLFSLVGYAILAFDDSKYHDLGAPANSPRKNPNKTPEVFANNKSDDAPSKTPPPSNLVQ